MPIKCYRCGDEYADGACGCVDGITLVHGDCREILPLLEPGSVDLVLTDPPYGIIEQRWDNTQNVWAARHVLKTLRAFVVFCAQPFTTDLINGNRDEFKYCWVWVKSQPGDCTNAKNKPMRSHEDIAVFSGGTTANRSGRRMPYFPQGLSRSGRKRTMGDNNPGRNGGSFKPFRPSHKPYTQEHTGYPTTILDFPNERGVCHPTQKPLALLAYLVETYSQRDEAVLDPFAGSGTTGRACKDLGRKCIMVEIEEKYCEIAANRLRQEVLF